MAPPAVEVIEVDTDDDEEPGEPASHPSSSSSSTVKLEIPDALGFEVKHEIPSFGVKQEISGFSMKRELFKREQEAIAPAAAAARAAAEAAARAAAAASAAAAAAGSGALGAKGAEEAMAEAVRAAEAARAAEVAAQAAASHRAKLDEDIAADLGRSTSKLYGAVFDRTVKPEPGDVPTFKAELHDHPAIGKKRPRASRVKPEHDVEHALSAQEEFARSQKRRVKREADDPELVEALRHAHAAVADVTREVKKMKEMKEQIGGADPQSTADRIVARSSAIRKRMAQGLTAMPAGTMRLAMEKMFHGKHDSSSAASSLVLGQDSCALETHYDEAKYPMRDDITPVQGADPNVPRSRFRGITWHRLAKKWQAVGSLHKKYKKGVYIGLFNTELDAAEARYRYHQALKARTGVDFNNLTKPWKSGAKGSVWKGLEEAPPESKAHTEVKRIGRKKFTGWHKFCFEFTRPSGEVIEYSVGRHLCSESQSAARIARLCYAKLEAGATREEMETYAEELLCVMRMHEEEYGKHPGMEGGLRPTGRLPDAVSNRQTRRVLDAQRNRRRTRPVVAPPTEMKALEDIKKGGLTSPPSGPSVADIMTGKVHDKFKTTDVKSASNFLEIALVSDDSEEEPLKKVKCGKGEPKPEAEAFKAEPADAELGGAVLPFGCETSFGVNVAVGLRPAEGDTNAGEPKLHAGPVNAEPGNAWRPEAILSLECGKSAGVSVAFGFNPAEDDASAGQC